MTATVETLLQDLLIEFYDYIVEESAKSVFQVTPSLLERIYQHQSYDELVLSISNDEGLQRFFPALRAEADRAGDLTYLKTLQSVVIWSDQSASGMTPLTLCASFISELFRHLWSLGDSPSLRDAVDQIPAILNLSRAAASKRAVRVPAVAAIHNIDFPVEGSVSIEIGTAQLRRPIRYDRSRLYLPSDSKNPWLALRFDAEFQALQIRAVYASSDPAEEQAKTQKFLRELNDRAIAKHSRNIQNSIDSARLAIALSAPVDQVYAPVQGFFSGVPPLFDLSSASRSSAIPMTAPYALQSIDSSAIDRITRFGRLIEGHLSTLRTGVRRLLLAITERLYAEDGLVDAVISWEALFSDSPDTMLRVCGSMARILAPDNQEARHELFKELRRLYAARNNLVHGSSKDLPYIVADRDAAVQFALEAFRRIIERDDLLGLENSSERSLTVLLDG